MSVIPFVSVFFIFFFKQKTAYEMRISDWSSDVCSSDLAGDGRKEDGGHIEAAIEKQLGRKDRLVCDAEGDQPNGQAASLLGRVDAIVKGVDAVLDRKSVV